MRYADENYYSHILPCAAAAAAAANDDDDDDS